MAVQKSQKSKNKIKRKLVYKLLKFKYKHIVTKRVGYKTCI